MSKKKQPGPEMIPDHFPITITSKYGTMTVMANKMDISRDFVDMCTTENPFPVRIPSHYSTITITGHVYKSAEIKPKRRKGKA